jgi:hypothetical protein
VDRLAFCDSGAAAVQSWRDLMNTACAERFSGDLKSPEKSPALKRLFMMFNKQDVLPDNDHPVRRPEDHPVQ